MNEGVPAEYLNAVGRAVKGCFVASYGQYVMHVYVAATLNDNKVFFNLS